MIVNGLIAVLRASLPLRVNLFLDNRETAWIKSGMQQSYVENRVAQAVERTIAIAPTLTWLGCSSSRV